MATPPLAALLHPELRTIAPGERRRALRAARRRPFDILELLGMAAGLVAAALFIRHGIADLIPAEARIARIAVAVLAFAAALGPFAIRRTRRGLRELGAGRRA